MSAALENAIELHNQLKEQLDENPSPQLATDRDHQKNVVWLANISAGIAQAQALESIASSLEQIAKNGLGTRPRVGGPL